MSLSGQSKGGQQLEAEHHIHGMFPPFSMHGLGIAPLEGQVGLGIPWVSCMRGVGMGA